MKNYLKKDHQFRLDYKRGELQKFKRRLIKNNQVLGLPLRMEAHNSYVGVEGSSASITKIRNRCIQTGRGRGIVSTWGISRIQLRTLGETGRIPGLRRANW